MNGILLIHKPKGMTSHDVVMRLRKHFKIKKIGHCGTLDPDATGVLVVCVGKATKIIQFLTNEEKEYIVTMSLGVATDTYDASGTVLEEKTFNGIENLEAVVASFLGPQEQMPPMYSAIKVNGKKLYEYARNHESVEIQPRHIVIKNIEILSQDNHEVTMKVKCSKGTYMRSLCVDIAKKLGYPGHMSALIRTQSGAFYLEQCATLEEVEQDCYQLLSIEAALQNFKKYIIEDENIVYHGKLIQSDCDELVAIENKDGKILAIYGPNGQGYLKNVRGLF